jgi:hypothetical protein
MNPAISETNAPATPPPNGKSNRQEERNAADCVVELTWKSEFGEKLFEHCRAMDTTENGVAVECPEALPLMSNVIIRAPVFQVAAMAQVRHCTWQESIYMLGLKFWRARRRYRTILIRRITTSCCG